MEYIIRLLTFGIFMSVCWSSKYHMNSMPNTWTYAKSHCNNSGGILSPDMLNRDIYPALPENDFIWINALIIEVSYRNGYGSNRRKHRQESSWNDAHEESQKLKCNMLVTEDDWRGTISLLKNNEAIWMNKYANYELPKAALDATDRLSVQCVGMMKRSDGTVSLEVDDCNRKHKFLCAEGRDNFAPTLTRLRDTLSQYASPTTSEVSTKDGTSILLTEPYIEDITPLLTNTKLPQGSSSTEDEGLSSGSLTGIIVGCIFVVLVLGILGGLYYRKRLQNRDAYRKSLQNYRQRQSSRRGTASTFNRDTIKSVSSNEGGDKKYEHCQKEVADECNRRNNNRYTSGLLSSHSVRNNRNTQGYQVMTGNDQVMSYEGFDPDLNHVQMIHGYVNGPTPGQNGLQGNMRVTSQVPPLPNKRKKKKKTSPDDQYEDPSKPVNNVPLHLDDLDQYENEVLGKNAKSEEKSIKRLDDLDSYENYQLPNKREKGKYSILKKGINPVKAPNRKQASNKRSEYSMAKTIDELESYENLDTPADTKQKTPSVQQDFIDDENYYDM